jgi:uncharacterized protein (DUF342 family)
MAIIAKGNAELFINQDETELKVCFTPDPEGLGWDVDAILKLVRDKNCTPLPVPAELEGFVQKASRSKTPMEKILVQGIPPEPTVPETVSWETLAVPGNIAPFQKEVLAKAQPPQIFRIKTEKVKRAALVKKPGKFPFMAAKEEIVAVWDKKEIKEPVAVNPAIKEIRYIERNNKLGSFALTKPGKPGKNIYGRPIAPPVPADTGFYLGEGIRKEKNNLYSEYTGFIRIGDNWTDIVPLAKPDWEINLGSDRVTLYFNFYPGDSRFAIPTGAAILKEAQNKGAPADALVTAAEIDKAIERSMKTGEEVQALSLFTTREAEARIDISTDLQRAELFLRKGTAGARPLEMSTISQIIRDSKIQDINAEELKKTIREFMDGTSAVLHVVVAEGKEATRGPDKEITLLAKVLETEPKTTLLHRLQKLKSIPDPRQGFPYSEAEQFCVVKKGTNIAQVSRPPNGEQGKDVYGRIVPGLPGNDPELKLFRGLHQQGDYVVADIDGLLLVKGLGGETGKVFWGTVIDYRDARITVTVSKDAMEASAELVSELGPGRPLAAETVFSALAEAGVSKGIDREAVETACKVAALKGNVTQILARGEMPVAAGGTEIKWFIPFKGRAGKLPVSPGMVLGELKEAAVNKAGFDVRGKDLTVESNDAPRLNWDKSIIARESGQNTKILVASFGGELSFDCQNLSINNLKEIKGDVGAATGNMNFSGEVRITGKVCPGYSVIAGKDVYISGSADSALISSGGKAVIVHGINGGGKGIVRARISIDTAFAESAALLAVEDIRVVSRCVSCNVKTNGRVLLSGEGGKLAGGICKARRGINAAELGDERRITEISFGQDYLIKDQIETAERESTKIRAALTKIGEAIKDAAGSPARLEAAGAEKVRLMKLLEQYSLKIFTLREKFEEHHESAITIKGFVHPGVVIESHGRYYEITEKRQGVAFFFNQETGSIMEKKL